MKFCKQHIGKMRGITTRGNSICYAKFGLQALKPTWIMSRQIELKRRTIIRYAHCGEKIWIRNVNYSVHSFENKNKTQEIFFIEIWTNGSVTPKEVLYEAF